MGLAMRVSLWGRGAPRPRYAARAECFCEVPMTIINDLEALAAMISERTGESPEDIAAQLSALPDDKKAAINRLATMISSISNDWRLGYVDATPHREDGQKIIDDTDGDPPAAA